MVLDETIAAVFGYEAALEAALGGGLPLPEFVLGVPPREAEPVVSTCDVGSDIPGGGAC